MALHRPIFFGIALTLLLALAACGQRGPLYLPDEGAAANTNAEPAVGDTESAETEENDEDKDGDNDEKTPGT